MEDIRIVKTKESLFETLIDLLNFTRFENITVSKLCKEARVNRSTFYAHYKNIDELFKEHFERIFNELQHEYLEINKKLLSIEMDSMVPLYRHILKHRKVYDVLLSEHAPVTYVLRFQQAIADFPSKVIKQFIRKNVDLELYYAFCVGATYGMIQHWKKTNYALSPEEMGIYTIQFFQHQISGKEMVKGGI